MMSLDVMRQLVAEAEVGEKSMPTANHALARWDCDEGTLKHLRYSANAIYAFKQEGVPRILRLSHAGDRTPQLIQAELYFITYLGAQGIPAMQPLPSKSGDYVVTVVSPYVRFYAAVFEYAPGNPFLEIKNLDAAQLEAWGRTVAEVHKAAEIYTPPGPCRRPGLCPRRCAGDAF